MTGTSVYGYLCTSELDPSVGVDGKPHGCRDLLSRPLEEPSARRVSPYARAQVVAPQRGAVVAFPADGEGATDAVAKAAIPLLEALTRGGSPGRAVPVPTFLPGHGRTGSRWGPGASSPAHSSQFVEADPARGWFGPA